MQPTCRGDGVVVRARPGQIVYDVEIIHPTLLGQQRLSFIAVVIQQRHEKGFVGVRIGLSAHDDAVQVQIHLLEDGVPQVIGD